MEKLFKRNKIYYYRSVIAKELQVYFGGMSIYIRSLKTSNIKDAKIISRFLNAKLNYIKSSYMILTSKQIKQYIDEFKKIHYDDILNRDSYLSLSEIDDNIKYLKQDIDIEDQIIKNELYDLMQLLDVKYNIDSLIDLDSDDIDRFKNYIVNIKINALNDIKKDIQCKIPATTDITTIESSNSVSIDEAIEEYIKSKSGVTSNVIKATKRDLNILLDYTNINNITDITKLKHKDLIAFRNHLEKIKPNGTKSSLNIILGSIATFIKYCVKVDYLNKDISKDIKFKLTVQQKQDKKRKSYKDTDIKKIFQNLDLIKLSGKTNKETKYSNEYEVIILIAMYTGARENEICQLTLEDINLDDDIPYIDINTNNNKNIKNLHSIRKVPIHSKLLPSIKHYIKYMKIKDKLFTIKASKFSSDYSIFKTKLEFDRSLVFHSFRNTLQNKLKQQKVQNMIINELTGHSPSNGETMTDNYTDKYDLSILQEELEKVSYDT